MLNSQMLLTSVIQRHAGMEAHVEIFLDIFGVTAQTIILDGNAN